MQFKKNQKSSTSFDARCTLRVSRVSFPKKKITFPLSDAVHLECQCCCCCPLVVALLFLPDSLPVYGNNPDCSLGKGEDSGAGRAHGTSRALEPPLRRRAALESRGVHLRFVGGHISTRHKGLKVSITWRLCLRPLLKRHDMSVAWSSVVVGIELDCAGR